MEIKRGHWGLRQSTFLRSCKLYNYDRTLHFFLFERWVASYDSNLGKKCFTLIRSIWSHMKQLQCQMWENCKNEQNVLCWMFTLSKLQTYVVIFLDMPCFIMLQQTHILREMSFILLNGGFNNGSFNVNSSCNGDLKRQFYGN